VASLSTPIDAPSEAEETTTTAISGADLDNDSFAAGMGGDSQSAALEQPGMFYAIDMGYFIVLANLDSEGFVIEPTFSLGDIDAMSKYIDSGDVAILKQNAIVDDGSSAAIYSPVSLSAAPTIDFGESNTYSIQYSEDEANRFFERYAQGFIKPLLCGTGLPEEVEAELCSIGNTARATFDQKYEEILNSYFASDLDIKHIYKKTVANSKFKKQERIASLNGYTPLTSPATE